MTARPSEIHSEVAVPCQTYRLIEQISLSLTLKLLPSWLYDIRLGAGHSEQGQPFENQSLTNGSNETTGRSQSRQGTWRQWSMSKAGWRQTGVNERHSRWEAHTKAENIARLRTRHSCLPPFCLSQDNWSWKCEGTLHRLKLSLALQFSYGAFNMCLPKPKKELIALSSN